MSAIRLSPNHFSGSAKVWDKKNGLGTIIRAMAVHQAKGVVVAAAAADFVDSSTGTAGTKFVDLNPNFAVMNASTAGGAQLAAYNTAIGKVQNAQKVITDHLNLLRAKLGLPALTIASGTAATAGTIPAQDKTVAAASGTSAASHASLVTSAKAAAANHAKLVIAYREIEAATGFKTPSDLNIRAAKGVALVTIPSAVAAAASPNTRSASATEVSDFLLALANNTATLAARFAEMSDAAAVTSLPVVATDF